MTILDAGIDALAGGSADLDRLAARFAPHARPQVVRPAAVEKRLPR
jgi:hypothetical protein